MSRSKQILDASKLVKEQYLKGLLEKMNEGEKISKSELNIMAKLEAELSEESKLEVKADFITDVHGISRFFGITIRSVQLWTKKGCPKRRHGQYDLKDVFEWWMENIGASKLDETDDGLRDVKLQYWREKMLRERNKRLQEEEELVPRKHIAIAWAGRMSEMCRGLEYLEYRVPPLAANKPEEEVRLVLRTETRAIRETYCRTGKFCE